MFIYTLPQLFHLITFETFYLAESQYLNANCYILCISMNFPGEKQSLALQREGFPPLDHQNREITASSPPTSLPCQDSLVHQHLYALIRDVGNQYIDEIYPQGHPKAQGKGRDKEEWSDRMPFAITEIDPNIPAHEHTTRKKSSNNCDRTGERTTADTLQKGKNEGFDKNMNSERTIKAQHQKEETNPEQDLEGAQQTSEISKIFEFSNDFERVRELYLSLCSERKMAITQNTATFTTSKKATSKISSCKCIIQLCLSPASVDGMAVYQLKLVSLKKKKAKVILIEGGEERFGKFVHELSRVLWKKGEIKYLFGHSRVNQQESVEYFFSSEQTNLENLKKKRVSLTLDIHRLVPKKMRSHNKIFQFQTEVMAYLEEIKEEYQHLRRKMGQQLQNSLPKDSPPSPLRQASFNVVYAQKKLEELVYNSVEIVKVYDKIYSKEYDAFVQKRTLILERLTIPQIFAFLEIEEHYAFYSKRRSDQKKERRCSQENQERASKASFSSKAFPPKEDDWEAFPYLPGVRCLEELRRSHPPSAISQSILLFQQKIKNCYNEYYVNRVKMSDMDDHLPITIFCVLTMSPDQVNLLAVAKMMLDYLKHEEDYEYEKKVLTNIEAAFEYVYREWKMDEK